MEDLAATEDVEGLVVTEGVEDLAATGDVEGLVVTVDVEDLAVTVDAEAVVVVVAEIGAEEGEGEAHEQVVLHNLKAIKLLSTDCFLSFMGQKPFLHSLSTLLPLDMQIFTLYSHE